MMLIISTNKDDVFLTGNVYIVDDSQFARINDFIKELVLPDTQRSLAPRKRSPIGRTLRKGCQMLQTEYDLVGECVCGRSDISAPAVMLESGVIVCSMCSKRRPTTHAADMAVCTCAWVGPRNEKMTDPACPVHGRSPYR